jgi:hypothetical protein
MNKTIEYKGQNYTLCNNYNPNSKYQLMEQGLVKYQIIAYVNSEEEALEYLKNNK